MDCSSFLCVVLSTALVITGSQAASLDCAARYKVNFQQALDLKQDCGSPHFKDCCQVAAMVNLTLPGTTTAGTYTVDSACNQFFNVEQQARCAIDEDGGWIVILRSKRDVSQHVDFNRTWADYEQGFGDLETEFWYGLSSIHCMTTKEEVELKVEVKHTNGATETWLYGDFKVDGRHTDYALTIGDANELTETGQTDYLVRHNGHRFSTFDQDHDTHSTLHCAQRFGGGWWFHGGCYHAFLTGAHSGGTSIYWRGAVSDVEMKVRPKSCSQTCQQL